MGAWRCGTMRSVGQRRLAAALDHLSPKDVAAAAVAVGSYPPAADPQAPWLFPLGTLAEQKAWLREAEAAGVLTVRPLGEYIGAQVFGVDLTVLAPARLVLALRSALNVYKVLVLRGQRLSHAQHIACARAFGDVTLGHIALRTPQNVVRGYPEVFALERPGTTQEAAEEKVRWWARQYELGADLSTGAFQNATTDNDEGATEGAGLPSISNSDGWWLKRWHTDITGAVNPPAFSILRPESGGVPPPTENPATSGDTSWANLAQAYQELPSKVQKRIQGLRGFHDLYELAAEHPLVTVHPETQERVLFISPLTMARIPGLEAAEGERLMQMLRQHATQPHLLMTHRWQDDDLVLWDNRATMHLAPLGLPLAPR